MRGCFFFFTIQSFTNYKIITGCHNQQLQKQATLVNAFISKDYCMISLTNF